MRAFQRPWSVSTSNPSPPGRTAVTVVPVTTGAADAAAYPAMRSATSGAERYPSGSSPWYAQPGRRVIQFGVSSRSESQRWVRHEFATSPALEDHVVDRAAGEVAAHREPGSARPRPRLR